MNPLTYYATQSPFTDPGTCGILFSDLPRAISEICGVIQGLCLDYEERHKYPIVNERLLETNSRYVRIILENIINLDNRPFVEARSPALRFMASSADFANLFCSMARFHGIPARKRVGFVNYIASVYTGYYRSREIAEYWDPTASRWRRVDPMSDKLAIEADAGEFDPYDLPEAGFFPAGKAWQACRAGQSDPEMYRDQEARGSGLVLANLILDLASINKHEMLNWDRFGLMRQPFETLSDKDLEMLDQLAELLLAGDEAFEELQALYSRETSLQVPRTITCDTPVAAAHEVELTC
jgi:hypothetical protein